MATKNRFLKILSIAALLSFILVTTLTLSGCSQKPQRYEDTREKMGTFVNIIIYANEENYSEIIESSFDEIDRLNKIASNYDSESSVSILNREGIIENAPGELVELINLSKEYNGITMGAFDITVNPILELWSEGLWEKSPEEQQQKISEALSLIDSEAISVNGNNIKFNKAGMSVTLGGVAKGYIVDKVMDLIKSKGVTNALVNAGGDIRILGSKPDGSKWKVSLENPDNTSEQIVEFSLADVSIATSGNYYRYFDPNKEVHHIIDPRTGFSANECISVTVIAQNATIADILATSVFVLGPTEGMKLVESMDNVEALIIDKERNLHKSSGIEKFIVK